MAALALPAVALAAPRSPQPAILAGARGAPGGTYQITGSVFGTSDDGQVGGATSSGHTLQPNDHLVALPACTDSSCPWVPDGTGTSGQYGPQTSCAEGDGQCWVEVVSVDTGKCAVAPVLDRGPLFVKDNWWAPTSERTYKLPQGEPAAVAAAQGADLGYGPGISDVGLNIAANFSYAAGIDLAAGTWQDIGLDPSQGVAAIQVTLLWQAGVSHTSICGGAPGSGSSGSSGNGSGNGTSGGSQGGGNATVTTALNLRANPSTTAAVLTVMPGGSRVTVTGGVQNGFYPVTYNGTSGWAYGDYLSLDSGTPGTGNNGGGSSDGGSSGNGSTGSGSGTGTATTTTSLNLRSGPGTSYSVLTVMPPGASVTLTGQSQDGFLSVLYQGTNGWASASYLDTSGSAGSGSGSGSGGGSGSGSSSGSSGEQATVTSSLNLRSGPGTSYSVIDVMPGGASVTITGDPQNGYYPVTYQGESGWASGSYLDIGGNGSGSGTSTGPTPTPTPSPSTGTGGTATATSNLNLRSGPSTNDAVLGVIPAGATVTLTGDTQNGYAAVTYKGTSGWAYAAYLS